MILENRTLYIWVEGPDDERFFERIIRPLFSDTYQQVIIRKYAQMRHERIMNFLKSIDSMGAEYLFFTDLNTAPCITARKEKINHTLRVDIARLIIVVKEIESWYLAGLSDTAASMLHLKSLLETNTLTKEQFNARIPDRSESRIDLLIEILKSFDISVARTKNQSFDYFYHKFIATP